MNSPKHGAPTSVGHKLRVLALHSFRTSGAIFKQQFERARMTEHFGDLLDVVFIDAPNPASGQIPKDVTPFFTGPYYEWFTVERMGDKLEYDEIKLKRSLDFVTRTIREQGPFDGLMGFSQGTAFAASVVALQQANMKLQDVEPLKFCILFAGFKPRYIPYASAWQRPVSVPSLHIFGDRDELRSQCKELVDAFVNPVVIQHTRGHSIPALVPHQLAVVRTFLSYFLTTHQSSESIRQHATRAVQPPPGEPRALAVAPASQRDSIPNEHVIGAVNTQSSMPALYSTGTEPETASSKSPRHQPEPTSPTSRL